MDIQTLVKNKSTGNLGVVVANFMNTCDEPDEVPVVYEGSTYFEGTLATDLEVIGPENAVADMKKCGGGQGAECCIFLMFGLGGWQCQRFGDLRFTLQGRKVTMGAQREPTEMFPKCQIQT